MPQVGKDGKHFITCQCEQSILGAQHRKSDFQAGRKGNRQVERHNLATAGVETKGSHGHHGLNREWRQSSWHGRQRGKHRPKAKEEITYQLIHQSCGWERGRAGGWQGLAWCELPRTRFKLFLPKQYKKL